MVCIQRERRAGTAPAQSERGRAQRQHRVGAGEHSASAESVRASTAPAQSGCGRAQRSYGVVCHQQSSCAACKVDGQDDHLAAIDEAVQDIKLSLEQIRQHKDSIQINMKQNKENPSEMERLQGFWDRMVVAERDLETGLLNLIGLRN